jgi:hypothetical protein
MSKEAKAAKTSAGFEGFVVSRAIAEIKTTRITNEHKAFARTPYASRKWFVEVRFISAAKLEEAMSASRTSKRGEVSTSGAYRSLFIENVLEWDFIGEDGAPLPCDATTKALVANQFTNLAVRIVDIAANKDYELLEAEEEEGKD